VECTGSDRVAVAPEVPPAEGQRPGLPPLGSIAIACSASAAGSASPGRVALPGTRRRVAGATWRCTDRPGRCTLSVMTTPGASSPATGGRTAGVAAVFDAVADVYDQVGVAWFTPIARALVVQVAPQPGDRALDIGCGRGAATRVLAEAVAPTGAVTAIDISPRMVDALRADLAAAGLDAVQVAVMDAAAPRLPANSFDVAVASLVVFFLPDPAAALITWHDLLVPGGRLGLSTFGNRDALWEDVDDVFTPYLPPALLDARTSGTTGPFSSDAGVEALVAGAGFAGARTRTTHTSVILDSPAHWETWSRSHGQRSMWLAVPVDAIDAVRAEAFARLERARGQDGRLHLSQQVRFTLAEA
jgi:ubiquinone/menaquinone biosynthesis C-methylase UbiE